MRSYASVGTCRRTLLSLSWIRFHLVDGLCGHSAPWVRRTVAENSPEGRTPEQLNPPAGHQPAQLFAAGSMVAVGQRLEVGGYGELREQKVRAPSSGSSRLRPDGEFKTCKPQVLQDCRLFTQRSAYYPNLLDASPTSLLLIDRHFCSVTGSKQLCFGRREASQRRLVNLSISVCRQVSTHHAQRAPAKKKLLVAAHFQ
jgi:hypothetical protein